MPPKSPLPQEDQYKDYIDPSELKGGDDYAVGNGLLSALKLPQGLFSDSQFTWRVSSAGTNPYTGGKSTGTMAGPFLPGQNPNVSTRTTMTVAGAMSWLRHLAVNNSSNDGQYDAIVHQLVAAGYITPDQARYGSYTTQVGNAFLRSVADVWGINNGLSGDQGQLVTWGDHISSMIQARIKSGQIDPKTELPISSGGNGPATPTAPTRTDSYTNPEDVKKAINDAAVNLLGRHLTDDEVAQFQSVFHGMEKSANDQAWAQTMAGYDQNVSNSTTPNTAPDLTNPPSPTSAATNYMDSSPQFAQDRENSLLGSYIGVLRSMVGMGGGGVSNAVS